MPLETSIVIWGVLVLPLTGGLLLSWTADQIYGKKRYVAFVAGYYTLIAWFLPIIAGYYVAQRSEDFLVSMFWLAIVIGFFCAMELWWFKVPKLMSTLWSGKASTVE